MGGPCYLADGSSRRKLAPACTDNFQTCVFVLNGVRWHSVEQCFQAMKFLDPGLQERIRLAIPRSGENDSAHGNRVWSLGQTRSQLRPDWEAVKVQIMYTACRAKLAQHEDLRQQLLSTGGALLEGAPSTDCWQLWNGKIQTRLREELRPAAECDETALAALRREFDTYATRRGGITLALPGLPQELAFPVEAAAPSACG
eukprot:NODE_19117_length_859_cov_4.359290.p1 GENE.NODE_19117_length_859_cov_4.359290~~NODE_19117_length_859_cov_4.359290.p1  ORF type:complete len:200 (-),score=42.44 NODE_19117_length_859_cov_4.359290:166-765(-)